MVMVPIAPPLDATMPTHEALEFLEASDFDLSLVGGEEVRVVYRGALSRLGEKKLALPLKANSGPPRMDRLVEHSLELAAVARRLNDDATPLLVVGREGPSFIITRSDFTRTAGKMGVLAVIAALDASLDALLAHCDDEGWELLAYEEQVSLHDVARTATERGEQLPPMRFLSLGQRLRLVGDLDLASRLSVNLGTQAEHELITGVRNDIAHGREVESGAHAIRALLASERLLDAVMDGSHAIE
jgi:hypothetical protein